MERNVEGSTGGSVEPYLDGARAVAVIFVVVFHVWSWSNQPQFVVAGLNLDLVLRRLGWAIDLFFLLSGFLLARPWFTAELTGARRPSLRRYFNRRLTRIVPAYYVSIVVLLALFVPAQLVPAESLRGWLGASNIGAHLAFLQNVLPVSSQDFNGMDGAFWTLTVEMLFYLSLPFAVRLFTGRRALPTLIACLAITQLWTFLALHSLGGLTRVMTGSVAGRTSPLVGVPPTEPYMRQLLLTQFPAFLFTFALGILLARILVRHRAGVLRLGWITGRMAPACVVAGLVGLAYLGHLISKAEVSPAGSARWGPYFGHTGASLMLALVLLGLTFGPAWLRRPLEVLPMRFIGWISYGIYLYHLLVLNFLFSLTGLADRSPHTRFYLALAGVAAVSVLVATLSWITIERPLLMMAGRGRKPGARGRRAGVLVVVAVLALTATATMLGQARRDSLRRVVDSPLGKISFGTVVPRFTGPATPSSAAALGAIYPREQQFLSVCGATVGSTTGLSSRVWGLTASAFACRTAAQAQAVLEGLPVWEASLGFVEAPSSVAGVKAFYLHDATGDPVYSYRFHVRFRSGATIVGVAISAMSRAAGLRAQRQIIQAAVQRYPVSP
jgi:peptidoglycan/LPS O-acetylase OafA/YrhL